MPPASGYKLANTSLKPKELFRRIRTSSDAYLLLPPGIAEEEAQITKVPGHLQKVIGLFSSGTTGTPKCIWNSYFKLEKNAALSAEEFEIQSNDRILMMAKPWHVAGLSWALMAEQVRCEYKFITTEKGDDTRWFKAVKNYNPTYLLTVPAVLRSLYEQGRWFVPKIVYVGSAIEQWDYNHLKKHSEKLYQGYGQTEAGGLISCHRVDLSGNISETEHHCYGKPPARINVKCEGTAAKPDSIFIKSPTAIYPDFYDTGDEGYIDSEERMHLLQRKKAS